MKNKMKWVLTALSRAALLVAVLSCKAEVNEVEVATDTTAPAAVTNVNAQAGDKQVVLTWADPADADLYGIRIAYTSAGGASGNIRAAFTNGVLVAKGAQTYIVTGLTNGTEYTFSVYAVDTSQNESTAATAGATPADSSDKTAPADVDTSTVTATCGNGTVLLNWTNPADSDFFGVEVTASAGGTTAWDSMVINGGKSLLVSGLTNGTEYTFRLRSYDKSLNASGGTTKVATPVDTADSTAPAEASSFAATAGDACATLSWTEPSDSDYYGIKISATPAAGTLASPVVLLKGTTSLSVTGLTNGTQYTFTAQTLDTSLNASAGTTAAATPVDSGDTTPPANVTNLTATNKDAAVLLTWTDAADSDIYGYEVSWNGTGAINRAALTAISTGSMIVAQGAGGCYISNLVNGTSYTFTVKSVDTSGNKSAGVTKTITPEAIDSGTTLGVSLKADTTAVTNGDVTVTVTVTSADSIKTVAYKNSVVASASALFALGAYSATNTSGYTTLTATNGTYTFTVSANGSFTAAALDTAGREECAYITVSNIDKTAPGAVTNLAAGYSSTGSTLTVTWTKPADSDLNHYSFLCTDTTNSGATVKSIDSVDAATTKETLTAAADSIVEGHTYSFTVYAYDAVGNRSEAATASFATAATAAYTGITVYRTNDTGTNTLAKTNLDTAMTDRRMTVVLTGSNLTKATTLVVKSKNTSAGTVVTLASPATASDTERVYTFNALTTAATYSVYPYTDDDGAITSVVATYTVTAPAAVTKVALATAQFEKGTSGREVTATITGTNLDIRGVTTVQVLDSAGTQVGTTKTIGIGQTSATTLSVDVTVPSDEGHYTVQAYIDGTASGTAAALWVYGTPTVASVYIPTCGTQAIAETVLVTIRGTNFSGVTGVTNTITVQRGTTAAVTATISSVTSATASISIPSTAGDYTVTVYINGTPSAVTGTLTVKDYTGWAVGDIMGADGTTRLAVADATSASAVTSAFTSTVPAAVICGFNSLGAAVGVGLKQSGSLQWAPSVTTGYSTNFTAIQSGCSGSSGSYTFTGDLYGGDNWTAVCKADGTAADNAATNYPVFNYANTYASSAATNLIGTACADGWYVPSISELYTLYKCYSTVNTSIGYVSGGTKIGASVYWSSSQYSYNTNDAWCVNFSSGNVYNNPKYYNKSVCVIRAF